MLGQNDLHYTWIAGNWQTTLVPQSHRGHGDFLSISSVLSVPLW
ncbi:hypothetical protein ANRL1_04026 [Anaerolineae bacterium]|nr:hypothetical protein ANRL1_04026 [Anaerolineae bacterium]